MEHAKRLISTIEHLINTKNKKHIVGRILLSTAIFLSGLAFTDMPTKNEESVDEQIID